MAIEEQFYIVAAPLFLILPRRYFIRALVGIVLIGLFRRYQVTGDPQGMDSIANAYMLALGGVAGLIAESVSASLVRRFFFTFSGLIFLFTLAEVALLKTDRVALALVPIYMATAYVYIFRNQGSPLVRWLSVAPLVYLGTISYGFYLYHNFLRIGFLFDAINMHPDLPNKVRVAIEFATTLAVASLSWRYIERPILDFRKSRKSAPT